MNKYCITGATGYLGYMLVQYISTIDKNAKITAIVRNKEKAVELLPKNVNVIVIDLLDKERVLSFHLKCDYLIHCASVTKSIEMALHPVEVVESIVNITQNVLELSKISGVKSFVYLSSMEVYGNIDCSDGHRVMENEMGKVDILSQRSCYPIGKRMAENICYCYYKEFGIPIKIVRLSQIFGKGVLSSDKRIFVQFVKALKNQENIVLHTLGNSMGNYCSIDDALRGIMTVLVKGRNGDAYNIVNEQNTMTIRQMAELVVREFSDGKVNIVFDIPRDNIYGYAADTGLRLSSEKLRLLGWGPTKSLKEMYFDLINS